MNFPMPPAFQLLRMMLRRAQLREQQEEEAAAKGESVEGGASGTTAEGEKEEAKPKKPRLVLRKFAFILLLLSRYNSYISSGHCLCNV